MYFDAKAFGQRIKVLRKQRGLTQQQMAAALHINIDHLSRIELGKRGISVDLLFDMADLLNVSADFLAKGTSQAEHHAKMLVAQIRELLDRFEASQKNST